jgi:hypothetical protein
MGLVLRYIWGTKICLMGWNAYKACYGDNGNAVICFLATSYFAVLVLATCFTCRGLPRPQDIDAMETEYLQKLEEGLASNEKQE